MTPSHFCDYLPFEEDQSLWLNKLEFPSPKDNMYQVWLILACWFWRRIFKNVQCIFTFLLLSPFEKDNALNLKKLEFPSPRMTYSESVKIGPVVLENINKWPHFHFLHFFYYLPFEKDLSLYLNKLEFPSSKDNLYQVWFEFGWLVLKKKSFKTFQCIFTLSLLSPLGQWLSPLFEKKTWIPST
jgi:hypothetical protein